MVQSVAIVYAKSDKGEEIPNPIVIGPFASRMEAFRWEDKHKKDKAISRIIIKDLIPA